MFRFLITAIVIIASGVFSCAATIRSGGSGLWSEVSTWESGRAPGAGDIVLIRPGHRVVYDVMTEAALRAVHVGGVLTFSREKDTLLAAGLIRIAPGEDCIEEGFDCHRAAPEVVNGGDAPALEVGTPEAPIPAERNATIRLTYIEGMDQQSFPALVCCGGRMDLHGAVLNRTWVKLFEHAYPGDPTLELAEPVSGWKAGDRVLIPTTEASPFYTADSAGRRIIGSILKDTQTEMSEIARVSGRAVVLKSPLKFKHQAEGRFCGEVANLSRNVVVESADPNGVRGHTMYHRGSAGSISYAEFRHLGKEGILGRYPIHFHLCGETMRGSSVVGASIWDSKNRWLTVHGTNYLLVRDCVGYQSVGHGFFFEDGTEEFNLMDRNLAVQALMGKPLPEQMLPFDTNDAAGFWWANCLNSFTRNVAVECEKHGYRFQMVKTETFDPRLMVRHSDRQVRRVDVRTLPFIRFEGNEAHSQRRFGLNLGGFHGQSTTEDLDRDGNVIDRIGYLGGDVAGVGPDERHPFRIKDLLVWRSHWAFHSAAPNVLIDGFTANDINYVVWRSNIAGHDYNHVDFQNIHVSTFFNGWGNGASRADMLRYASPVDTMPPVTLVTHVQWLASNLARVSGVAVDDAVVREVRVNDRVAELQPGSTVEWSAIVPVEPGVTEFVAASSDDSGNEEVMAHKVKFSRSEEKPRVAQDAPRSIQPRAEMMNTEAPAKAESVREILVDPTRFRWPLWNGRDSVATYARQIGVPATQTLWLDGENLELVLIPAGSFVMGSPGAEKGRDSDEGPQHRVVVSQPFYLGKYEVTQAQYQKVAGSNPSYFKGHQRPVEQVSWNDAMNFVKKAGNQLRLPTEAEWEFACRAGTVSAYYSGETKADGERGGWFGYDSESDRAHSNGESYEVGKKVPNAFGLCDMIGNVYEWCADWYSPSYYQNSPAVDPTGTTGGDERVLRGGSWEALPASARSANRNGFSPNSHGYVVGFRVAMPVPAP